MKLVHQTFLLPDRTKAVVRTPDPAKDVGALVAFLSGLPTEQRGYLRYDVTREDTCRGRLDQIDGVDHFRLVTEVEGRIVADGTLDREPFFWTRHVAELRCVVAEEWMERGVGPRLVHELVQFGHQRSDIELLFAEVIPEQTALIRMLEQVGFAHEATRRRFAKDLDGNYHDVHIMSNDLELIWRQLEQQLLDMDTRNLAGHY
jgi:RimJ/RimL family protein N-acetyltransferase